MICNRLFCLVICCFFGVISSVFSQQKIADRERAKPLFLGDTTTVYYATRNNPFANEKIDTSLDQFEWRTSQWNQLDPLKDISLSWILGAPSFSLLFEVPREIGFRVGLSQFDVYRIRLTDIKYYKIASKRPYTSLFYSQLDQRHNVVEADFGYQFSKEVYFGIQYNLIAQSGYFDHQKSRNQNVGVSFRYIHPQKGYYLDVNLLTQASKNEDNGGLAVDSVIATEATFLPNIAVLSRSAETNYSQTKIAVLQRLYNKTDSLSGIERSTYRWQHEMIIDLNAFKFFDDSPSSDLYGDFLVNSRGIRYFIDQFTLSNKISFEYALGGSLTTAPLSVMGYIAHDWHRIAFEPNLEYINNYRLGAQIRSNPSLPFSYDLFGELNYTEESLDVLLSADLAYQFKKAGKISAFAKAVRQQPSLVERQMYLSWDTIWNQSLEQRQYLSVGAKYSIEKYRMAFGVQSHWVDDWVYLDSTGIRQRDSWLHVIQLTADIRFKFKFIHLDNRVIWQPILNGAEQLRFPEWILHHNLYVQSYLFNRNLLLKAGVKFSYYTSYFIDRYIPYFGMFANQNTDRIGMTPRLDVYLAAKIWQFSFFVRGENLLYFLDQYNYETAPGHPIHNFTVRLGVRWRLFD